uniref:Xylanolytic transcriptional activator regulatory domain-containing protein n=1 Tax=Kwoniella dejecticola CBS 10117 TaxID=1296121 RepID=A0A1A6ADN0_9TREE|nr:uncharacterized protein I303_02397 [Kwoniella dejecticola CBS 10117]OBR88177.1 hypothetical protein I303_02397 [Kwoniella dejecticola CBS 10117]
MVLPGISYAWMPLSDHDYLHRVFDIKTAESLQKRLSTLESLLADHGVDVPSTSEIENYPFNSNNNSNKRRRESSTSSFDYGSHRSPYQIHSHHHQASPVHDMRRPSASPRYRSPSTSNIRQPISSHRDYPIHPALHQTDGPNGNPMSNEPNYWIRPSTDYSPAHPPPPMPAPHMTSSPQKSAKMIPMSSSSMHNTNNMHVPTPTPIPRSPVGHSHGTLVIGQEGRSRYLGPTAGTEWLKNQEMGDGNSSGSRDTPEPEGQPVPDMSPDRIKRNVPEHLLAFPFPLSNGPSTMESLLSHLPAKDDAEVLMDSYYRYFAWNHDTAPRKFFEPIFDRIFKSIASKTYRAVHPQQLALLFAILAMGTLQNLELPPNDPTADEYLSLAKGCLTKGDFLNNNTIAGVQTLIIMAHYLLETEKGRNGDSAWPLWGLAMRIIVAMGLHRDGARWNLPADVVEERRQVFWAAYAIEILQANCFSRPTSLALQYIDTAFPIGPSDYPEGSKSYQTKRFELIQLSAKILDTGMSVHFESYESILSLYTQLCTFERTLPFDLRCRTAMLSLPSEYPDTNYAKEQSPDVTRRNLKKTFQQFTLALNISEHVLFLHRPYFVMAMHDQPVDPTRSVYGRSYLAVIERCSVIIQIVSTLYDIHSAVSSRQWFLWYHIFTAAVCLGTMVLRNPTSVLSQFALTSIDQAISVYSLLIKQNNTTSMVQNHDWLIRLRSRVFNKIITVSQSQSQSQSQNQSQVGEHDERDREIEGDTGNGNGDSGSTRMPRSHRDSMNSTQTNGGEEEDLDIVGWKTRLIESASNGTQIAINIPSSSSATASGQPLHQPQHQMINPVINGGPNFAPTVNTSNQDMSNTGVAPAVQQVLQQHLVGTDGIPNVGGNGGEFGMDNATDLLLHQFWDPMMLNDSNELASANWWSWM